MSASPAPSAPPSLLSPDPAGLLEQLTGSFDAAGLWWLSGYAAGLARAQALPAAVRPLAVAAVPEGEAPPRLTILYGSQAGNAKRLAEKLARQVEDAGPGVRVVRADAYPTRELASERYLAVVIRTRATTSRRTTRAASSIS